MRWLKELLFPAKKCERVGHVEVLHEFMFFENAGSSFRAVVSRCKGKFLICERCGKFLSDSPRDVNVLESYQSASFPQSIWGEMKDKGYSLIE